MTIHLTYTYLWVVLGLLWFLGVIVGNIMLSFGEIPWWSRVIVWTWPVSVPLVVLYQFGREVLWP